MRRLWEHDVQRVANPNPVGMAAAVLGGSDLYVWQCVRCKRVFPFLIIIPGGCEKEPPPDPMRDPEEYLEF